MPIYVQFTTFTEEGRKILKERVKGESKESNKALEEMGIKILAQYSLLGQYDMVNILEAPSKEVAMKEAMEINHRNIVTTLTMPAIPISELRNALKD